MPFGRWLQSGWHGVVRDVLLDRRARERDMLEPAAVERLLDAAARGVHASADAVWSLLNLELWFRTFIDGEGIQTLPTPQASLSDAAIRGCSSGATDHAHPLAQREPAAAARQGRQAPYMAPDASSGAAP